jgi:murein DD-endopeptidase MepM/ murein hydrolase activator NlpD
MAPIKKLIFICTIFISTFAYSQKENNLFISPLKIPVSLSASFGELRPDHYHSGIDIKTQGVTGKDVVASDDGYVYLLMVSPVGFGKAIFIRHPSGYSTVYCHLDHFIPEIDDYIKTKQYEYKSFAVSIYPPEGRLVVKKGDIIGFSGNSGSSSGPHLHYEIRRTDGEKPLNPLLFNHDIEDNLKPVIEKLGVYTSSQNTTINGKLGNLYLNTSGADGIYHLTEGQELFINGLAGFGISAHDFMNGTPNRFGINSIELQIDSITWFSYILNEFSFYETRYINAHIDYETEVKENIEIEKAFLLPNDKLSLYKTYLNNGLFDFSDKKTHSVKIKVSDSRNNMAYLSFIVKPCLPPDIIKRPVQDSTVKIMPYNRENIYEKDGIKIVIPKDALYDTLSFKFSRTSGNKKFLSDIFQIHDRFTPLQKSVSLSIKPYKFPNGKGSKLIIVQIDEKNKPVYSGGILSGEYVKADILSFGRYAVSIDTIPPVITANGLTDGADLSQKTGIRIKITDDFSGIKSYSGSIDGAWVLFEYDPRIEMLVYSFDPSRIIKSTKHKLSLIITDNCNNSSTLTREFIW